TRTLIDVFIDSVIKLRIKTGVSAQSAYILYGEGETERCPVVPQFIERMTDGDIVYTEEVASLQEMVGELAVLRKLVFERRTQDVAGNAVAAIECIQGVGSSHIVIDIETEATVSVDTQIPILVGQTGGQTAIVRGLGTLT